MGRPDERSGILAELAESVCSDPDVEFAVAFGSRVEDDARSSSDLDLAVKFDDDCSATDRFQKRCFLSGELQRENRPFIDVSDVESLPIDVARDAVGGTFVCGDESSFRRFKANIEAEFEERRDDLRARQQDVIDRIAERGLRG